MNVPYAHALGSLLLRSHWLSKPLCLERRVRTPWRSPSQFGFAGTDNWSSEVQHGTARGPHSMMVKVPKESPNPPPDGRQETGCTKW